MKKQFVVIGLGLFGYSVVKTLAEANVDVLAIDMDEEKIEDISQLATHALALDATDEAVLKGLGLRNFDVAVICVGDIQSSILITLICKEQGVKNVIAKAQESAWPITFSLPTLLILLKFLKITECWKCTFQKHGLAKACCNLMSARITM